MEAITAEPVTAVEGNGNEAAAHEAPDPLVAARALIHQEAQARIDRVLAALNEACTANNCAVQVVMTVGNQDVPINSLGPFPIVAQIVSK